MLGKGCNTCNYNVTNLEHLECSIPQWIPKKNESYYNEIIPDDCPLRNKSHDDVTQEMIKRI